MAYEIELRDLKYFETIAELGHVGRAAQELYRSQPALTSCIRRLEGTFGTALFERAGRGIRLTPAGEVLWARAKRLRLASDEVFREMKEVAHGESGHIRIGVAPTPAQLLLPPALRVFLAKAKGVTLKTVIGQNDVLRDSLKAGELDLLVSFDPKTEDGLLSQPIFEDVVVVVASRSHEIFRKRGKIKMQDLTAYEWVLAAPSVGTRQWLDQAFDSHGLPRANARIETNLVLLLPRLIAQTGLLSFISRRHLAPGHGSSPLREVSLRETTMRRWCKVFYRKDGYLPPAAQGLLDLLRTRGKKLSGHHP
jgi:DNA-binding transcriptional LysR family regulator